VQIQPWLCLISSDSFSMAILNPNPTMG